MSQPVDEINSSVSKTSGDNSKRICNNNIREISESKVPWPVIIVGIVGIIILLYIAIGPYINSNKRMFGITLILLWTLIWCLLLWVLWNEEYYSMAWWMMIIPIFTIVIFFVLVIFLIN